jgi:hypothetical protein
MHSGRSKCLSSQGPYRNTKSVRDYGQGFAPTPAFWGWKYSQVNLHFGVVCGDTQVASRAETCADRTTEKGTLLVRQEFNTRRSLMGLIHKPRNGRTAVMYTNRRGKSQRQCDRCSTCKLGMSKRQREMTTETVQMTCGTSRRYGDRSENLTAPPLASPQKDMGQSNSTGDKPVMELTALNGIRTFVTEFT